MAILNTVLCSVFDALLYPFRDLSPIVGLAIISLATGVAMLLVFKATSDQSALAAVKRQIHAGIFEIRLFSDDPLAILRAQAETLRHSLRYMRLTLVPTLWMLVPLVLAIIQLHHHYGFRGLEPGTAAIVKVSLNASISAEPSLAMEAPPGLEVETLPLWIPSMNEVDWRIRPHESGEYELRIRVNDATLTKRVRVSDAIVRRAPVRASAGLLDQLLYPAEAPIRDGPVQSISVSYPDADVSLLGWETHWLIVFFILAMVFAFALRRPFGVTL